ncbi:putative nesprin-1 isoform X3 [Apostichopus japonicus]|uniref:Putative nesprin-1 isoform X3 n=1 Tax=Stichopus japonicus TaxID=307972 RepID=A0A2G8K4H7_STIJA|nr:putative nesprin-1 isoform X3 [Apostichopus japonicus]
MLSKESNVSEEPQVRGTQSVTETKALIVCDPDSGELFAARQATDPEDLSKLKSGYLAPDDANNTDVMRVYNPDTNEMTKGVPAGSWLEKQETPLSKTDSVALEVQMEKEPASAEEEEDVPVRQQLVTEMGPAYTLSPLGGDGVAGDDSPDVDYVLCQETSPRDSPKVTGLKAAPSTEEPVTISDPHTGEVFVAEPCGDPSSSSLD